MPSTMTCPRKKEVLLICPSFSDPGVCVFDMWKYFCVPEKETEG